MAVQVGLRDMSSIIWGWYQTSVLDFVTLFLVYETYSKVKDFEVSPRRLDSVCPPHPLPHLPPHPLPYLSLSNLPHHPHPLLISSLSHSNLPIIPIDILSTLFVNGRKVISLLISPFMIFVLLWEWKDLGLQAYMSCLQRFPKVLKSIFVCS